MVTWGECADAFEPDGNLRDIQVRPANAAVWEAALPFLVSEGLSTYRVDGTDAPRPRRAADALGLRPGASPVLLGRRDGIEYACHFFSESEIEVTFLPWEIDRPERFESLLSFVRDLGRAIGRDAFVTFGDDEGKPFLRYDLGRDGFVRVAGASVSALDDSLAAAADAAASGTAGSDVTDRQVRLIDEARWPTARRPLQGMREDLDLVMKAAAIIKRDVEAFMADIDTALDELSGRVAALEARQDPLRARREPPARRLRSIRRAARPDEDL